MQRCILILQDSLCPSIPPSLPLLSFSLLPRGGRKRKKKGGGTTKALSQKSINATQEKIYIYIFICRWNRIRRHFSLVKQGKKKEKRKKTPNRDDKLVDITKAAATPTKPQELQRQNPPSIFLAREFSQPVQMRKMKGKK